MGDPLSSVDSPAAIVDLDTADANITAAADLLRRVSPGGGVTLRPHLKAHKTPALARRTLELSAGAAVGVCAQKVVEAEAAVAGGIPDVLVSNQVVCPRKLARLAALARGGAAIGLLVDSPAGAAAASAAAVAAGVTLRVLVEVDVGQRRCGVPPAGALGLAREVAALPGLALGGIQAYHGGAQHVRGVAARAATVDGVVATARAVRDELLRAGLPCPTVTGGGSGTWWMEAASGVFTEVQPGSYVLGDADYARNECDPAVLPPPPAGSPPAPPPRLCWGAPFAPALFLLTQVMSRREPEAPAQPDAPAAPAPAPADPLARGWVVVDSGLKAQSTDSGPGVVAATVDEFAAPGRPPLAFDEAGGRFPTSVGHLTVASVSDEHSTLLPGGGAGAVGGAPLLPAPGTKLMVVPGHCDPFVNHFDWLVAVRGGVVQHVWRVAARSPGS